MSAKTQNNFRSHLLDLLPIASLGLMLCLAQSSCRSRNSDPSPVKHAEREFTIDAPPFFWTDVASQDTDRFIRSNSGGEAVVLPQDHDLTRRLQTILEKIDQTARSLNPEKFRKIPKPFAVVIKKDDVNAFVTARGICVRQKAKKGGPSTPAAQATGAPQIDSSNWVLDVESPGFVYGTTLPDETANPPSGSGGYVQDRCPIVTPEAIGWDPQVFISYFNGALPEDKEACKLALEGDTIVAPPDDRCGYISDYSYPMVRFRAAANTVFFFTGLLRQMSETSVTTVAAHELAHFYRGHAVSVLDFRPYHFLQTKENELIKPAKTDEQPDLRQAMKEASYLATPRRTEGAQLDANLYGFMTDFWRKLEDLCPDGSPCFATFGKMKAHAESPLAFELWGEIESKALQGAHREYYLQFEALFLELAGLIKPATLNDSWIERLSNTDTSEYLKKLFPPLREQADLAIWVRAADRAIAEVLPKLREPFVKAAEHRLGFYSTEEEADEVGFELAARQGVAKPQVGALWTEFMEAQKADGYEAGLRETDWSTCLQWYQANWKTADGKDATANLMIDSLANIHHGLCYRLFNSQREWVAHDFDKVLPKKPRLNFDNDKWKGLSTTVSTADGQQPEPRPVAPTLKFSPGIAAQQRLAASRRATCILAPETPRDLQ